MSDPVYKPPLRFVLRLRLQKGGCVHETMQYLQMMCFRNRYHYWLRFGLQLLTKVYEFVLEQEVFQVELLVSYL